MTPQRASSGLDAPRDLARRIPGYRLNHRLGQGGFGVVFHATQVSLDRPVAVKILSRAIAQDPGAVDRFMRESAALSRLRHPHIVSVIERGDAEGLYYYVMEHIEGPSLLDLMRRRVVLTRDEFRLMLTQICDALDYIHQRGIVHRDIKPSNVLRDKEGAFRLADFGLAHYLKESSIGAREGTSSGSSIVGTPMYLAPEQLHASDAITPAADIYSLAVVAYEMLTGVLPLGRFKLPSEMNPTALPPLDEPIRKALSRDIGDRYASVREFSAAMMRALDATPHLRLRTSKRKIEADDPSRDRFSSSLITVGRRGRAAGFGRTAITAGIVSAVVAAIVTAVFLWPVAIDTPEGRITGAVEGTGWNRDMKEAAAAATSYHKPIFLLLHDDREDALEFPPDGARESILAAAIPVALAATWHAGIVESLSPPALPHVFLMDASGSVPLGSASWPMSADETEEFLHRGGVNFAVQSQWLADLDEGRALAARENKVILLLAGCGERRDETMDLRKDLMTDRTLASHVERMVPLSLERRTDRDRLESEFGFFAFPVLALLSPKTGEVIGEEMALPISSRVDLLNFLRQAPR